MNIPSQIKVGARVYKVIELDEDAGMQSDTVGQTDFRAQTIKLLRLASRQAREQTLLHEIVRGAALESFGFDRGGRLIGRLGIPCGDSNLAIAYDMGYTTDHDEREIDLLANEQGAAPQSFGLSRGGRPYRATWNPPGGIPTFTADRGQPGAVRARGAADKGGDA